MSRILDAVFIRAVAITFLRVSSFLFWFHAVFIVGAISTGFFLPLSVVVLLVVLHRIHVLMADGCVLSKIHQKLGGLAFGQNYLQLAADKLFGVTLTLRQGKTVDYVLASLPVCIALVRTGF